MAEWTTGLLLALLCASAALADSEEDLDFAELYEQGKRAYLDNYWSDCASLMLRSAAAFNEYKKSVVRCRMKCKLEAEHVEPMSKAPLEDMRFFERQLRTTLCLVKCSNEHKLTKAYTNEVLQKFERLEPYDYLQLCYFQRNELTKAADAAFTFLVANPNHPSMKMNFEFYLKLPEVDQNNIVNLEAPEFISHYVNGVKAYDQEDFNAVIQYFELSLVDYLQTEEECRAFCEGPFNQGWYPDFTASISNHFTYCLKCKANCSNILNNLNGERHSDLLPSHYHYLQFAYYKVGKLKEACEAATSYLLFFPADEDMIENIRYYKTLPKAKPEYFQPREEAIQYVERYDYEWKILNFIEKEFTPRPVDNKKGDDGDIEENATVQEDEGS